MRHLILVLPLLLACGGRAANPASPRPNRDVVTREQIDQSAATDGYTLVQRMRPDYLRPQRGATSIRSPAQNAVVYVDGVRRGGPDVLRSLRTNDLEEIRFITGRDATTRWGTDHGGGVIDITTRR